MNRAPQLAALEASLRELLAVLAVDPSCHWRDHFETSLAWVLRLREQGFTQPDLNELSSCVMHVYGGHSSFNDYAPLVGDGNGGFKLMLGAERFSEIAGAVHERALALRAVGNAF